MGPAKHLRCVVKVRSHLKGCKCWPCHAFEVFEVPPSRDLIILLMDSDRATPQQRTRELPKVSSQNFSPAFVPTPFLRVKRFPSRRILIILLKMWECKWTEKTSRSDQTGTYSSVHLKVHSRAPVLDNSLQSAHQIQSDTRASFPTNFADVHAPATL